jgi:hypothetical protein
MQRIWIICYFFEITVYSNIVGNPSDAGSPPLFVGMLDRGGHTQASLAQLASETPLNAQHIDLVELANTGIEYL